MTFFYLSQWQTGMAQTSLHNPSYNVKTSFNELMLSLSAVILFVGVQPTSELQS